VQIASGGGTVNVGARLGGYSGGIPAQGYTAEIESNGTVNLWRVDNFTLLGSSTLGGFSLGTWYTLALRANGSSISVEVNGSTVIGPVTDSAFTSGDAGVWSYAPTSAGSHRFDNFNVTVLGGGQPPAGKVLARRVLPQSAPTPAPNQVYRLYYYAGATRVAVRVRTGATGANDLYFLHSDHLGSTTVTTDLSQNIVGQQRYFAYGEPRWSSGALHTDRRFTGQREESGLGSLYDYNARYYSPLMGRFISADSIVPGAGEPQAFN
jgi:RHS repeat-associated protein